MPKANSKKSGEDKLDPREFVLRAINKLRGSHRGIHVVFSGFNQAFREYYGYDPKETVDQMANDKVIDIKPARGGIMIYPHDPNYVPDKVKRTIDTIVG